MSNTIYFFLDPGLIKVVAAFTLETDAAQYAHETGEVVESRVYEKRSDTDYELLLVGRQIALDKYTEEIEWVIPHIEVPYEDVPPNEEEAFW